MSRSVVDAKNETRMRSGKSKGFSASFLRASRVTLRVGIFLALAGLLFVVYANLEVSRQAKGLTYSSIQSVPVHKVGMVLGTSWASSSGSPNRFFLYRIHAAAALYRAGKIQHILVSGDNQYYSYNEPQKMRQELVALGVNPEHIFMDYAGFSTLDSVYRSSMVFKLDKVLVISQGFQNERAVFLGRHSGIAVSAFNARSVEGYGGFLIGVRELFARAKAVVDVYILDTQPRFLGEPLDILPETSK
ncbi:MAG: vancomycin high temperature exclusion protein [Spirochaetaceae bacterium]|nr:MAG: vancomycin high temperature exclusion protein [Spirochaetaceae bacterium]